MDKERDETRPLGVLRDLRSAGLSIRPWDIDPERFMVDNDITSTGPWNATEVISLTASYVLGTPLWLAVERLLKDRSL